MLKQLDWQMILFVGTSLAHDLWIYLGLPKVYYWDMKKLYVADKDDNNKAA